MKREKLRLSEPLQPHQTPTPHSPPTGSCPTPHKPGFTSNLSGKRGALFIAWLLHSRHLYLKGNTCTGTPFTWLYCHFQIQPHCNIFCNYSCENETSSLLSYLQRYTILDPNLLLLPQLHQWHCRSKSGVNLTCPRFWYTWHHGPLYLFSWNSHFLCLRDIVLL